MINPKINISSNLFTLRKYHKWSQEEVADKVGVSRQAIAKWELGESVPDIIHCDALAKLYDVTLDDLLHYNEAEKKMPIPPKGKHIFGTATLGERGQIVLPKKARELFDLKSGDTFIVLADESPESGGIALVPSKWTFSVVSQFLNKIKPIAEEED